jgi:nitric oxide reductase subunit B
VACICSAVDITLLPLGTLQLFAALEKGYWFARSAEFMQQPVVDLLVWLRVPGDIIFSIGALALMLFVIGLWVFPRREGEQREHETERRDDVRAASAGLDRSL